MNEIKPTKNNNKIFLIILLLGVLPVMFLVGQRFSQTDDRGTENSPKNRIVNEVADTKNNLNKPKQTNTEEVNSKIENKQLLAPILGSNFSIKPNTTPPDGFKFTEAETSLFIFSRGLLASYLFEIEDEFSTIKSGIKIFSREYDNRFSQEDFAVMFKNSLGSDYRISSEEIIMPKNIRLTKIVSSQEDVTHFIGVTSENYYVIKVYNPTNHYLVNEKISDFTSNILDYLYLN